MNISLDDLDIGLGAVSKAEVAAMVKAQGGKAKSKADAPERRRVRNPISNWIAEGTVIVIQETSCACGATFRAPAAPQVLVHFRNKKSNTIWEIAEHPARFNKNLPKMPSKVLYNSVEVCEKCWMGEESKRQPDMFMSENAFEALETLLELEL